MIRRTFFLFTVLTILTLSGCSREQETEKVPVVPSTEQDTEAPDVNLNTKYIFSNDINSIDLNGLAEISDESAYTIRLCKFQKIENAKAVDDATINAYLDTLEEKELETLLRRPENLPIRDGIYTAVYLVEDCCGNRTAKELLVFYDAAIENDIVLEEEAVIPPEPIVDVTTEAEVPVLESTVPEVVEPAPEVTVPEVVEPAPEVTVPEVGESVPETSVPEVEELVEEEADDGSHYIPVPKEWNLIVVNKWNKIPENYKIELVEVSNGKKVDSRISEALQEMFDAAKQEGVYLMVREGYRTAQQQQQILDEKIQTYIELGYTQFDAEAMAKKWVAESGTSEHELGLAVDINADQTDGNNNRAYGWLAAKSHEYGFILRYPEGKEDITGIKHEPWHYRYVGVEAAREIREKGLCLEEYLLSR